MDFTPLMVKPDKDVRFLPLRGVVIWPRLIRVITQPYVTVVTPRVSNVDQQSVLRSELLLKSRRQETIFLFTIRRFAWIPTKVALHGVAAVAKRPVLHG